MVYRLDESAPVGGSRCALIAALAAFLKPDLYVELGVDQGETFRMTAPHCAKSIAVDIADNASSINGTQNSRFVRSDTVAFLRTMPAESVDFAFLDSSHDAEITYRELAELDRVMVVNGVIAMHDTYPPRKLYTGDEYCSDVHTVPANIAARYGWEVMTLPAEYGVTVCRKHRGKQVQWMA